MEISASLSSDVSCSVPCLSGLVHLFSAAKTKGLLELLQPHSQKAANRFKPLGPAAVVGLYFDAVRRPGREVWGLRSSPAPGGFGPVPPALRRPPGARSCPPWGAEGGSPRPAAPGGGRGAGGCGVCSAPALRLSHFMGYRPAPLSRGSAGVSAAEPHKRHGLADLPLQSSPRPATAPARAPRREGRLRPAQPLLT